MESNAENKLASEISNELQNRFESPKLLNRLNVPLDEIAVPSCGEQIRIVQWNILAQGLVPTSNLAFCPKSVLDYERRRLFIQLEIALHSADIICLEEADIHSDISDCLNRSGIPFESHFAPKPQSICLQFENNHGPDGCAVFFRADRFRCLNVEKVQLLTDSAPAIQVALFLKLQSLAQPNLVFHIVCTHLKAGPTYFKTRECQGILLLENMASRIKEGEPCFVCGDFNADPDEPVIRNILASSINLSSVYLKAYKGKEPEFTTWKMRGKAESEIKEVCHTIDYIWYSKKNVTPLNVLAIPTKEEIGSKGLPCLAFPSDHISLRADFFVSCDK